MGVKIIVVDTEVEQEGLADCTIVSDNYRAGYAIGEYMMKKQESGRILVLEHETAISGRRRVQGFKDSIAGNKRFEIVNEIGCKGQYEIALPLVEDYIQDGGEFDTVFCLNDLAGEAAVTAVRSLEATGTAAGATFDAWTEGNIIRASRSDVRVFTAGGQQLSLNMPLPKGLYIVRSGQKTATIRN